jgi:hypothetical protein
MAVVLLVFWGASIIFSIVDVLNYIPTSSLWQGIDNQNIQGAQKTKLPQIQRPNEEMGKKTEQVFLKGRSLNG